MIYPWVRGPLPFPRQVIQPIDQPCPPPWSPDRPRGLKLEGKKNIQKNPGCVKIERCVESPEE